jgi:putative ABC transport system permease protein
VAAILATIGLYGVLTTAVRQRTAEIGMRMTFGATSRNIFGLMIGEGMRLSGFGLLIGLFAAWALTRSMSSMLVGVSPTDPVTYAAIVLLFLAIAVAACLIPARRAAALDPATAIRQNG